MEKRSFTWKLSVRKTVSDFSIKKSKSSKRQIDFLNPLSVYLDFKEEFHMSNDAKYLGTRTVRGRDSDVNEQSFSFGNKDTNQTSS